MLLLLFQLIIAITEVILLDKIILKFFADVLYIKGVLCSEELEAIMDASNIKDLDTIINKMLDDEYVLKRGETYGLGNAVGREEYYRINGE